MPIALEAPGVKLRSVGGQGGMAISHYVTTEPADMGPVLKSLLTEIAVCPTGDTSSKERSLLSMRTAQLRPTSKAMCNCLPLWVDQGDGGVVGSTKD